MGYTFIVGGGKEVVAAVHGGGRWRVGVGEMLATRHRALLHSLQ